MHSEGQLALVELPRALTHHVSGLDSLPEALLLLIASRLDSAKDLCNLEAVNKFCRSVGSDNAIWKQLCCDKFGAPHSADPPSWKELYRFNHQYLYGVIFSRRFGRLLNLPNGLQLFINM